jgi:hypothetical protein
MALLATASRTSRCVVEHCCACRLLQRHAEMASARADTAQNLALQKLQKQALQLSEKRECEVCFTETATIEGVWCPAKEHFICCECMAAHVKSRCSRGGRSVGEAAAIFCVKRIMGECQSMQPFSDMVMALFLLGQCNHTHDARS